MLDRPAVPHAVKRTLRQEAGFGCCICGSPIIQYHHIIEWSADQHYRPCDMMVLCPTHHDQATKRALTEAEQRQAKALPHNIKIGRVRGLLAVKQSYPALELGSVTVVNEGTIFDIDGEAVLSLEIEDNAMLLSLALRSSKGELLCGIERNEWVSGDPMAWDIEADWQILTIREKAGTVNLMLTAKTIPASLIGQFWGSGRRILITKDRIKLGNMSGSNKFELEELALVGFSVRIRGDSMQLDLDPSGGGVIVSWPNRRERLWRAAAAWAQIVARRKKSAEGEIDIHGNER